MHAFVAAREAGSPYDLVLMDVQMPGIDGLEAARRIRAAEADSGAPRTRILALTANAQAEDREACLAAGMDGFLVKPLDRERLREAIDGLSPAARPRLRLERLSPHCHNSVFGPCCRGLLGVTPDSAG